MKQKPLLLAGSALALTAALIAAPVLADRDCDLPLGQWQPREAVQQMAEQKGWQIQRLKIDDGCYEIRAIDAEGRHFKAKLDPQTLQVIKLKQRDRKQDHKHERQRERQHWPQAVDDAAQDSATPSPVFTPGSTPRARVD